MNKNKKSIIIFITALLFLEMFIGNYGNYQIAAVPSQVYQAYSLNDLQFSSIMTAPMLPSIFLSIVAGVLVDRFGASRIVGIGYAISAIGFVIRVFASSYSGMLVAMALSGIGVMVLNSNLAKITSLLYPMEKVGSIVGVLMAGSTASMAVAYATTAFFPSLEAAFWLTAIAALVICALWLLFVRSRHFEQTPVQGSGAGKADAPAAIPVKDALGRSVRSRNVWILGLALMFILGGSTVTSNFQTTAMIQLKGFSEAAAGSFGTVLMVGAIIGSIVVPMFAMKLGKKTPVFLLVIGVIAGLCEAGIVLLPTAGIYICSFLNGGLRSGLISLCMSMPVMFSDIGPKYAGTAGGFAVTLELIGAVVIPTYIIVPIGAGNLVTYFMLGTACIIIGTVLCFVMAKTSHVYDAG